MTQQPDRTTEVEVEIKQAAIAYRATLVQLKNASRNSAPKEVREQLKLQLKMRNKEYFRLRCLLNPMPSA
jgi:hypothetical protein